MTGYQEVGVIPVDYPEVRFDDMVSDLLERRILGLGRQERAEKRTMRETEVQIANSGLIEICFQDGPSFRVRS